MSRGEFDPVTGIEYVGEDGAPEEPLPAVPVEPPPHEREEVTEPAPAIPQAPDVQEPSPNPGVDPLDEELPAGVEPLPAGTVLTQEELEIAIPRSGPIERPGPNDDVVADLPREDPDDDTPPDATAPTFIIDPNAYGPKVPSVKLANGQPVGQWLHAEHAELDGGEVAEMLILMGMDGELAAWFGLQRDRAREARGDLLRNPAVASFSAEEERRRKEKKVMQDAFLEAYRKKAKS